MFSRRKAIFTCTLSPFTLWVPREIARTTWAASFAFLTPQQNLVRTPRKVVQGRPLGHFSRLPRRWRHQLKHALFTVAKPFAQGDPAILGGLLLLQAIDDQSVGEQTVLAAFWCKGSYLARRQNAYALVLGKLPQARVAQRGGLEVLRDGPRRITDIENQNHLTGIHIAQPLRQVLGGNGLARIRRKEIELPLLSCLAIRTKGDQHEILRPSRFQLLGLRHLLENLRVRLPVRLHANQALDRVTRGVRHRHTNDALELLLLKQRLLHLLRHRLGIGNGVSHK